MIRSLLAMMVAAVLTLTISACAVSPELTGYPKARAPSAITRVEVGYARIRKPAVLAIAGLPEPAAGRARVALRLADAAIATIRRGASLSERLRAIASLTTQAAILASLIPPE